VGPLIPFLLLAGPNAQAGNHHPPVVFYYCPCQTVYLAGPESGDLQVRIVGRGSNMIEAYFGENLARYDVPDGIDLCRYGAVLVPQKNPFGTFAIRYSNDRFTAFGWMGSDMLPLTSGRNEYRMPGGQVHVVQIDLEPGVPIDVIWVTSRILKIVHGHHLDQEYIVRFDGDSRPWKLLYAGPVSARD